MTGFDVTWTDNTTEELVMCDHISIQGLRYATTNDSPSDYAPDELKIRCASCGKTTKFAVRSYY